MLTTGQDLVVAGGSPEIGACTQTFKRTGRHCLVQQKHRGKCRSEL